MTELTPLPTTPIGSIPAAPLPEAGFRPPVVSFDPETGEARPWIPPERNRGDTAMPPPESSRDVDRSFRTMEHTWFGTDGVEWPLTDPSTGVFLVQESVEGLHLPLVDEVLRESPSLAGGSFHGYRVKPRQVVWPIYIYTDESSEAFFDLDQRFFQSLALGEYGTWRVARPDGSYRELRARMQPSAHVYERDPGRFGWQKYVVQLIADEEPFWTRPNPVAGARSTFEDIDPVPFFGPNGNNGPPLQIAAARAETSRSIFNDGDEPVYPVVTINGPMDTVDLQIGEREYHVDCDLEHGEWLRIDTNPRTFSIKDSSGANRIKSISSWIFEPLPKKKETTLLCVPVGFGEGSVIIDTPPLYHRAW